MNLMTRENSQGAVTFIYTMTKQSIEMKAPKQRTLESIYLYIQSYNQEVTWRNKQKKRKLIHGSNHLVFLCSFEIWRPTPDPKNVLQIIKTAALLSSRLKQHFK